MRTQIARLFIAVANTLHTFGARLSARGWAMLADYASEEQLVDTVRRYLPRTVRVVPSIAKPTQPPAQARN